MKRYLINSGLILFVMMAVVACAPSTKEPVTESPVPSQLEVATASPTSTKLPTPQTSELIPVTGPPMEIGSVYAYLDGSNLLAIPAGEFIMGVGGSEVDNPEHRVNLDDYWIYSTKVTNQQFALCVELGQCTIPDLDDNLVFKDSSHANDPVVGVTHDQAAAYCEFVQGRLPTEAEWEKAARGPKGNVYPWGDETPSCDLLNFNQCVGRTTSVIEYPDGKSFYGSLDMAGNTFEWVADWYDPNYYDNSPLENPPGPESGALRSVRSSSFESNADQVTIALRDSEDPESHRPDLGFRCVVDNPTYFAPFCESPTMFSSDAGNAPTQDLNSSALCPELDISQEKYCVRKLPVTNITFSGPPDSIIDAADCTTTDNPALFVCQSPETIVSIAADCQVDISGDPACPPGYSLNGDTCQAEGTQGECLSGYTYDEAQQCCVEQNNQGVSATLSVCPVGTYYVSGQNACVPTPVQSVISIVQTVEFTVCEAGGKGGSCQPPANGCGGVFYDWNPSKCKCICTAPGYC